LYWQYIRSEITPRTRCELSILALLYVLVNNTIFACYNLADPGTIALVKSSGTVITALVMIVTIRASVSNMQWLAIALQLCGLLVTQYNPDSGSTYGVATYLLMAFHVFMGALAGVYNQVLLQRESCSMNANNMTLYACGTIFNLIGHLLVRQVSPNEPRFFGGYNSIDAILVIVSNVFIGLAITAVYKYADAIIKCFATAFATGILLYISPILFGTKLGFLAIPGTFLVFVASWMYIRYPAPKETNEVQDKPRGKLRLFVSAAMRNWPVVCVLLALVHTMTVVVLLWLPVSPGPRVREVEPLADSPLRNVLAFVRWNHAIPERVPTIMKYEPYFHTMHISMSGQMPSVGSSFVNITHDTHDVSGNPHKAVSKTMQLILDNEPGIEGLLFFHFDAWITPMDFADQNLSNMAIPLHGGPNFWCSKEPSTDGWERAQQPKMYDLVGKAIAREPPVLEEDGEIVTNPTRYSIGDDRAGCRGWSDIYYMPRRFFKDFIYLVDHVFIDFFHEMSISTIMHIIDQTRSLSADTTLIDDLPCWGSCCSQNPSEEQLLGHRCGHKLDLPNGTATIMHFEQLDLLSLDWKKDPDGNRYL
jgi:UDP-galactose transporter